ncbi:MAG: molybdopterin-dependent oxidoreductase [Candidatus Eremiobacteraeota bacterium]|nr:molybdopterin-dependent oxidoreductase [Candidatus Eremiobacteraeota bacterium]
MSATLSAAGEQLVTVTIDGIEVRVPKGTLLVEAAKSIAQEIPVYCYHTKLGPAGLCRICMVEIEGMPKLQIACNLSVTDGMIVRTKGPRVDAARATVLELFLVNHPLDCPICDKGGECDLQDYALAYGRGSSDVADPKLAKPKAADLGPTIVLDEERCIVCQRCVRFDDVIARESQLVVKERGARDIIATATGQPYRHNFTGNVTELCPVGALTSKTYRFKSRPWDLDRTQTTCAQCSVGCQQYADMRYGKLLRTMLVEDDPISDGWLCDRGRYNIGFYDSPRRLTQPLYRKNGRLVQIGWDDAFLLWSKAIRQAIATHGPPSVGAIGGGRLTNEEAFLLQHLFRALGVANLDWRAGRQRQATPGRNGATLSALDRCQAIVVAGESPQERAPVFWLRMQKARRANDALIVESSDPQRARREVGDLQRVALVWDGCDLSVGRSFAWSFEGGSDLALFVTGEQNNARGAEAMGMLPGSGPGFAPLARALDGYEMFEAARRGELSVLSIFGANPARNANDPREAAAALSATEFLVVSDLFMTETAEHATLVLPAKGAFEKHGTTANFGGELLPLTPSLQAPDFTLADGEMLDALAEQLGVAVPTYDELHGLVVNAVAKADLDFALGDERFGPDRTPSPRTVKILDGGGTWRNDPTLEGLRS